MFMDETYKLLKHFFNFHNVYRVISLKIMKMFYISSNFMPVRE